MRKRVIIFGLTFIMLFSLLMFTGCSEYSGREIEVDGWTLFRFRQSGQVNIISANCESLVADGVLYIPSRIGRYNIHGFGRWQPTGWYGSRDHHFRIDEKLEIERVVLAVELHLGWLTTGLSRIGYVELLCTTFERIENFNFWGGGVVIIPNGTTQKFLYKAEIHLMAFPERINNFIEKSEWLASRS